MLTYCQYTETDSWPWATNTSLQAVLFFGATEDSFYFQADESTRFVIDMCRNVAQTVLLLSETCTRPGILAVRFPVISKQQSLNATSLSKRKSLMQNSKW